VSDLARADLKGVGGGRPGERYKYVKMRLHGPNPVSSQDGKVFLENGF